MNKNYFKNHGFTLIEMIVVTAVMGSLIVGITGILLNSFKAKSIVNYSDKVESNGIYIIGEMRKNLINADSKSVVCTSDSVTFNDKSSNQTVISCTGGPPIIASASATTTQLSDVGITVDCPQFISCSNSPITNLVNKIDIGFTLTVGAAGQGAENLYSKSFNSSVTVRE